MTDLRELELDAGENNNIYSRLYVAMHWAWGTIIKRSTLVHTALYSELVYDIHAISSIWHMPSYVVVGS